VCVEWMVINGMYVCGSCIKVKWCWKEVQWAKEGGATCTKQHDYPLQWSPVEEYASCMEVQVVQGVFAQAAKCHCESERKE